MATNARFDLEQLGPIGFQDLAAALAIAALGAGVQAMGPGSDGGRDMYHRGPLHWGAPGDSGSGDVWNGLTVFQVKQKARVSDRAADNASWLWGQLRDELGSWADPNGARQVPDFVLLVTNVPLSPTPGAGGHDSLLDKIQAYVERLEDGSRDLDDKATSLRLAKLGRLRRIKKWRVWDRNQLESLLRVHDSVRRAFSGFLTAQDVFANLSQFTDNLPVEELKPALQSHARMQLTASDGLIYFDEAGDDTRGLPIHEVAIDLPVTFHDAQGRATALQYVLERAEHVLRPSVGSSSGPRHLVLTGAPGNGKTTVSKFLMQIFRAALLEGSPDLSEDQRAIVIGCREGLKGSGVPFPTHRRWPMRVDLAEYAHDGAVMQQSLVTWIAQRISKHWHDGVLRPRSLQMWMRQWPTLLLLDGLDEVTDANVRKTVIEQITTLVNEAEANQEDLLVVLTTRPMGYVDIAPNQFERIELGYLTVAEATKYGERAVRARHGGNLERVDRILGRLEEAAADEALRNLLKTPLQVLILTIIIDSTGRLPLDRFGLFHGYYDAVFRRERGKQAGLSHVLQEYGPHVQRLHELVGFELHARAELGGDSNASLSIQELRELAWKVLVEADYRPDDRDKSVLDAIVQAATTRLVLITPKPDDSGYGFDVRSIQELMAGMYLTSGTNEVIASMLRIAAPSPHWRHTWIFAAGRLFHSLQDHQRDALVAIVESIDSEAASRLGRVVRIGPRLALDLLDDGMANSYPKYRNRLLKEALRRLDEAYGSDLPAASRTLIRYAKLGDEQCGAVAEGLRDALTKSFISNATTVTAMTYFPVFFEELEANSRVRALAAVKKRPDEDDPERPSTSWETFDEEVATIPMAEELRQEFEEVATFYKSLAVPELSNPDHWETSGLPFASALDNPAIAMGLERVLEIALQIEPELGRVIRDEVLSAAYRRPVAELLRAAS
jgi:hypothetical protein